MMSICSLFIIQYVTVIVKSSEDAVTSQDLQNSYGHTAASYAASNKFKAPPRLTWMGRAGHRGHALAGAVEAGAGHEGEEGGGGRGGHVSCFWC